MRLFPGVGDKGTAGTSAPSCNRARGGRGRGTAAGAALQSSAMKEASQAGCCGGERVSRPCAGLAVL